MQKIIAACGNDCSACRRFVAPPYVKSVVVLLYCGWRSDIETGSFQMKKSLVSAAVPKTGADTLLSNAVRIRVSRTVRNVRSFLVIILENALL